MAQSLPSPIYIDRGATLRNARFRYSTQLDAASPRIPVDLTGCELRAHARESVDSPDILHVFSTEAPYSNITLDDQTQLPSDGLTGRGWYQLHMTAEETSEITWSSAMIQLEIVFPSGVVVRHWNGKIKTSAEVTRDV